MVRCKMICQETGTVVGGRFVDGKHEQGKLHRASFLAVYDGSDENKKFFASTPNGKLTLDVVAEQHFEAGKSYFIDISEAP